MVMAPPSTGNASSSRKAVTSIDHTNSGILCSVMPGARMLKIVVMKLTAPRIEDAPVRCIEKITMSTDMTPWPRGPESGGKSVQPVPAPLAKLGRANVCTQVTNEHLVFQQQPEKQNIKNEQ